jgi:hypothetical protein
MTAVVGTDPSNVMAGLVPAVHVFALTLPWAIPHITSDAGVRADMPHFGGRVAIDPTRTLQSIFMLRKTPS